MSQDLVFVHYLVPFFSFPNGNAYSTLLMKSFNSVNYTIKLLHQELCCGREVCWGMAKTLNRAFMAEGNMLRNS